MGTRHLTAVVLNGEYKIAQYGQWDGYPSGQGLTALSFVRSKTNREKLKRQLKHCIFVPKDELQTSYAVNPDNFERNFPFIDRDHGAEILDLVSKAEERPIKLQNSIDFAGDSLFCEWAYVIDFDKNVFEVYKGFSKKLIKSGRFSGYNVPTSEYRPIRMARKYSLSRLPTDKLFLKIR